MEKKDIALKLLRAGANNYNSGDYVSSITLCGAAEEILGKIAKQRKGYNQLENETIYLRGLYEFITGHSPSKNELIKTINKTKNELKHNDSGSNEWVEADLENEAAILFVKATKNYILSYNELPDDRIIRSLFEQLTL